MICNRSLALLIPPPGLGGFKRVTVNLHMMDACPQQILSLSMHNMAHVPDMAED